MIDMVCHCGKGYKTPLINLRRGLGLSCNTKCAAKRRFDNSLIATRDDGQEIVMDMKPLRKRKRTSEAASIRYMMREHKVRYKGTGT